MALSKSTIIIWLKQYLIVSVLKNEQNHSVKNQNWHLSVRPNGLKIGAENAGVNVNEQGFISVDDQQRTNVQNIFANA